MRAREAWAAFSLVFVLSLLAAGAYLALRWDQLTIPSAIVTTLLAVYFYIVYKRYRVEVVPEGDLELFDDPDDLRILCEIYGLDADGGSSDHSERLRSFARENQDRDFVWVAPRAVSSFGSSRELRPAEAGAPAGEDLTSLVMRMISDSPRPVPAMGQLVGGRSRSQTRLEGIERCPVCDVKRGRGGSVCAECGADLEFYAVLAESKVGRELMHRKSGAERRKLRYPVPDLEER
jgi:hypothetical protein